MRHEEDANGFYAGMPAFRSCRVRLRELACSALRDHARRTEAQLAEPIP
jgi:hypothetical protein